MEFQEERKGLGFFFFSKFFKRAIFCVGKGGGDFPPLAKGCFLSEMGYFSFSTSLEKLWEWCFFKKEGTFSRGCFLGGLEGRRLGCPVF